MAKNNENLKRLRTELIARRDDQAHALCGHAHDEERIARFAHLQLAIEGLTQAIEKGTEEEPDLDVVSAMIG